MMPYENDSTYQSCEAEEICKIAACLSNNFLKSLFKFCSGRNYFFYLGCLTEILKWSHEFYKQYCHDEKSETPENARNNAQCDCTYRDEVLIAWGNIQLEKFFAKSQKRNQQSIQAAGY